MAYVSYEITQQPYYLYIEYVAYNVVGGVVRLTFDSTPSSNSADYYAIANGGILNTEYLFYFNTYDQSLFIDGNTAQLTMPTTMSNGCYIQIYYQNNPLPFKIRAAQDPTYVTPAIFSGLPVTL